MMMLDRPWGGEARKCQARPGVEQPLALARLPTDVTTSSRSLLDKRWH